MKDLVANLAALLILFSASLPARAYEFKDTTLNALKTSGSFLNLNSSENLFPLVKNIRDINADGIDDLLISGILPSRDDNQTDTLIYVVFGSKNNPSSIDLDNLHANGQGFAIKGANNDFRSYRWSSAGDINDDGINDFMFGLVSDAYVIFGRSDGFTDIYLDNFTQAQGFKIISSYTREVTNEYDWSEWMMISEAGDFNNDGIDDIMVGLMKENPLDRPNAGSVYILFGHPGAFSDVNLTEFTSGTQGLKIIGAQETDCIGFWMSSAGDFNGDGIDDVVIPISSLQDVPGALVIGNQNKLYVIYGHEGEFQDLDLATLTRHQGFQITDRREDRVLDDWITVNAGDFNGDGLNDIAFTLVGYGASNDPLLSVVFGVKGGYGNFDINDLQDTQGFNVISKVEGANSLLDSVDVNGDGLSDLLIGLGNGLRIVFGRKEKVNTINLDYATSADGFKIMDEDNDMYRFSADCLDFNDDGAVDIVIGVNNNVTVFYGETINNSNNVAAIVAGVVVPCVVVAVGVGIGIYVKRKRNIKRNANGESEMKKMEYVSETPNQDLPMSAVGQWSPSQVTSPKETAPMLFKTLATQEPQESAAVHERFIEPPNVLHPQKGSTPGNKKTEKQNESGLDLASVLGQKMDKQGDVEGEGQIQQDLDVSSLLVQAVKDEEMSPGKSDKWRRAD